MDVVDVEFVISRFREDLTPLVELLSEPSTMAGVSFRLLVYDKGGQGGGQSLPLSDPASDSASASASASGTEADGTESNNNPVCAVRSELAAACARKSRQVAHSGSAAAQAALRRFTRLVNDKEKLRVLPLQNLGREADTYLHHLSERYDQLAAVTVLLPASCMNDIKSEHTRRLCLRVADTRSSVLAGQWVVPSVRTRLGGFMIKKWQVSKNALAPLSTSTLLPLCVCLARTH